MNPKQEIEIVGLHLELTEALKIKVNEMAVKLYEHDSGITRIRVELVMEKHTKTHLNEFIAKGHLADRRDHFDATAQGDDLYRAISDLGDKLDRLIRNKSRRRVAERRNLSPIDLDADVPKVSVSDA